MSPGLFLFKPVPQKTTAHEGMRRGTHTRPGTAQQLSIQNWPGQDFTGQQPPRANLWYT